MTKEIHAEAKADAALVLKAYQEGGASKGYETMMKEFNSIGQDPKLNNHASKNEYVYAISKQLERSGILAPISLVGIKDNLAPITRGMNASGEATNVITTKALNNFSKHQLDANEVVRKFGSVVVDMAHDKKIPTENIDGVQRIHAYQLDRTITSIEQQKSQSEVKDTQKAVSTALLRGDGKGSQSLFSTIESLNPATKDGKISKQDLDYFEDNYKTFAGAPNFNDKNLASVKWVAAHWNDQSLANLKDGDLISLDRVKAAAK